MRYATLLSALALGSLAGCGGNEQARGNCPPVDDAAVAAATRHYIQNVEPRPHRFMIMAGTDSTLPETARRVLQDAGPTFLYSADTAQQIPIRRRLAETGSWNTLLVVLRDREVLDGGRAEIEIGGYFIRGLEESEQATTMRVPLTCVDRSWQLSVDDAPERVS
jgi:hypothetical protein